MSSDLRKIIALSLALVLVLALGTPLLGAVSEALPAETGCCNHESSKQPEVPHIAESCPFCCTLSLDLAPTLRLNINRLETSSPFSDPAEPVLTQVLRDIDQPPERT